MVARGGLALELHRCTGLRREELGARARFPDSWWWGQAQGFADADACVAFAGGQGTAGALRTEVTGLVVRLPDGKVYVWGTLSCRRSGRISEMSTGAWRAGHTAGSFPWTPMGLSAPHTSSPCRWWVSAARCQAQLRTSLDGSTSKSATADGRSGLDSPVSPVSSTAVSTALQHSLRQGADHVVGRADGPGWVRPVVGLG